VERSGVAARNHWSWVIVTGLQLELLLESRQAREAGLHARRLRERLDALPTNPAADDWAIAQDPLPGLLRAELRGGLLTRQELVDLRSRWIAGWRARTKPFFRRYLWVHGFAAVAETPEEAREALAVLPDYGGVPPFRPGTATNLSIGRTYLAAGRVDEALPYLRRAAGACFPMDYPVHFVAANLHLGHALAEKGDTAGACAAYAAVLKHWEKAQPRSASADEARRRRRHLGCPPA
jgi:eukaryotic-like serine/threonine-protein kinase